MTKTTEAGQNNFLKNISVCHGSTTHKAGEPCEICDKAIEEMESALKEICICAAIIDSHGYIWRGHRHGDCYIAMTNARIHEPNAEQGFVTSRNRFVSREEGRILQDKAGIKSASPEGYMPGTLFSEDLY